MTKITVFLFFILSSNLVHAQIRSNKDLVGKWSCYDLNLDFFADGRLGLIMKGGTMPGATYKTDFYKYPVALDIMITQERKKIVLRSFITFINDSTIKMEEYKNDDAAGFLKGHSIVLKKTR